MLLTECYLCTHRACRAPRTARLSCPASRKQHRPPGQQTAGSKDSRLFVSHQSKPSMPGHTSGTLYQVTHQAHYIRSHIRHIISAHTSGTLYQVTHQAHYIRSHTHQAHYTRYESCDITLIEALSQQPAPRQDDHTSWQAHMGVGIHA
jgi:hypothetical protein